MSHTLLFVDDEENILKALRRLFHRLGHEIITATGGAEALRVLRERPVSVIVSDQRMPGMTGAELLAEARTVQPEAARIMLTGYSDIRAAMQAINEGQVARFLPKPWDDDALLRIVEEALTNLDVWREHAALQLQVRRQNDELQELNANLERKVLARTSELRAALKLSEDLNESLRQQNLATVKAFAGLLDLRNPSIGAHCRRVAGLVAPVCANLGMADRQAVQGIVIAALLHDIGKIAFPDAVLIKDPRHLGHQERTELRKHPVLGQGQVQIVEGLSEVALIIRHHHENVDGSGYPDGLEGENIPLGARVLRILDAYDNLTKGRPPTGASGKMTLASLDGQVSRGLDGTVYGALLDVLQARKDDYNPSREAKVSLDKLEEGMVLSRDLITDSGVLLVAKDETLRPAYIAKIRNLRQIYPTDAFAYVYRR